MEEFQGWIECPISSLFRMRTKLIKWWLFWGLVRYRKKCQFLILGSASKELIQQSSESLAGRIAYIEVHPFSILEKCDFKKLLTSNSFVFRNVTHEAEPQIDETITRTVAVANTGTQELRIVVQTPATHDAVRARFTYWIYTTR